jgi:predicted lipoprotein with Yx(FWY)xxD motif
MEWDDKTASLIAEDGRTLETYPNSEEAVDACIRYCHAEPDFVQMLMDKYALNYIEVPHRLC